MQILPISPMQVHRLKSCWRYGNIMIRQRLAVDPCIDESFLFLVVAVHWNNSDVQHVTKDKLLVARPYIGNEWRCLVRFKNETRVWNLHLKPRQHFKPRWKIFPIPWKCWDLICSESRLLNRTRSWTALIQNDFWVEMPSMIYNQKISIKRMCQPIWYVRIIFMTLFDI